MGTRKLAAIIPAALVVFGVANAQTPSVNPGGVFNAASLAAGQAVAPGSLVSIFGSNFASGLTTANSVPLSTSLANVSVTFNGVAAPVLAVVDNQINAQLPWDLSSAANGTAQVVVTHNNVSSAPQAVSITNAAPGIFAITLDSSGHVVGTGVGQAIAYGNTDGQIAAPPGAIAGLTTHPAKINDPLTLAILATGLGPIDNPVPNGDIPRNGVISRTMNTPIVTVGGIPAQVVFSGMSGFVGVYQLNIVIAPGTPTGNAVPLQIQMNGITSTDKVTIAVSN